MQHPLHLVSDALSKADLVGTPYIPTDFKAKVFLQIEFPSGASVQLGNSISIADAQQTPIASFLPEDLTSTSEVYTLLAFDPDAPSKEDQKYGPWRHWVIGGLKPASLDEISSVVDNGEDAKTFVKFTEEALSPWVAPSPGAGSGPHRYTFLLYRQPQPLLQFEQQTTLKSNDRPDRRNFDVAKFASDNKLELVGSNYFLCENP